MNAYELADELDWMTEEKIVQWCNDVANMLRQQADRIAGLEKQLNLHKNAHHKCVEILQEKQSEPVAWMTENGTIFDELPPISGGLMPLYTTPHHASDVKQTKPLSDKEINQIIKQQDWFSMSWVDMVRRIEKIIYSKLSTVPNGLTDPKSYYQGYEDGKTQTKPLSDEEISYIHDKSDGTIDIIAFARAIEAKVRG